MSDAFKKYHGPGKCIPVEEHERQMGMLRYDLSVAQETNQTYLDYTRLQAKKIEKLEAEIQALGDSEFLKEWVRTHLSPIYELKEAA